MKKFFLTSILLLLLLVTTGCLGKLDINRLSTASAVGVDIGEKELYKVTIQSINASALTQELSSRSTIVVYSEEGKTFFEALRKLTRYFPSRVFMAHFQLVVFGEEFARSGEVDEVLGFLYNDPETRQIYNFVVVKGGKANDLLKILTPVSPNPAAEINESIQAAEENFGTSHLVYIDEFISCINSPLNDTTLTGIEIEGDVKDGSELKNLESSDLKGKIKISSLAVFKDDYLVGWLTEDESKGINYYENRITSGIIPLKINNDKVTMEITKSKTKTKFILKDNKPTVNISISLTSIIGGIDNGTYSLTKDDIKKIEEDTSNNVKDFLEKAILRAQGDIGTDFLSIANLIHRTNPKYWKEIKENYEEVFKEIDIKVEVKTKLINAPQ